MRLVILLVVLATGTAHAASTVWNTEASTSDGRKKLTTIAGNPNEVLAKCRCVAGIWRLAKNGESKTHFAGTLESLSFNYAAKKSKKLTIKIRKTRVLMGVQRDYRGTLHAIVRGSGQLVLQEVTGGEYEVVGFGPEAFGDLFANNERWKADPKKPPKAAKPSPVIDPMADATKLAKVINDYRASIKLPRIPISPSLTKVAQAHVLDLNANKPVKEGCNSHSWSNKGTWSGCCYDSSTAAAKCMWIKPKEIAGYKGNGYEIAAFASGIEPEKALEMWQKSQAHHEVMINRGIWKKKWGAMGVAIEGDYGVAWFGEEADTK